MGRTILRRLRHSRDVDADLAIIGCGPKALACYAKRSALKRAGLQVPAITIFEQSGVAAHWDGSQGFTDGNQPLGTSPEKDVVFPYQSPFELEYGLSDLREQLQTFSWHTYLIQAGLFDQWIDRGRPQPSHREWAKYQRFVVSRTGLETTGDLIAGKVVHLRTDDRRWQLGYEPSPGGCVQWISARSLMVSGPGDPKRLGRQDQAPFVLDGQTFWTPASLRAIESHPEADLRIAILGAGETAAATAARILKMNRPARLDVISRKGTLFTRGDSFFENHVYSDPTLWPLLSKSVRREIIERTDRGVVSGQALQLLNHPDRVRFLQADIEGVVADDNMASILIKRSDGAAQLKGYHFVVVALGFDPTSFLKLLDPDKLSAQLRTLGSDELSSKIAPDLSLEDFAPTVYLPMLAALQQGPGFPNLSCLGRLSDAVLAESVKRLNQPRAPRVAYGDTST